MAASQASVRAAMSHLPSEAARVPSVLLVLVRFVRTRHWVMWLGVVIIGTIVIALVAAPWVSPYDPAAQNLLQRLQPPSAAHWFGTDHLGRDAFSRMLFGGRFSVTVAFATVMLSVSIGVLAGILSARQGGLLDEIIMRIVDFLLSFPEIIVAMFLVAVLGPGYATAVVAITMCGWAPFARLARGLTLEINARDYVRAAEILGCTRRFIIFRHIIPNAIRPIAAMGFLRFGHMLITVGGLSFLGLGVQPPNADWASMLAQSMDYVERAPLLVVMPGLALFVTALSVTWIGQGLELRGKSE